MEEVKKQIKPMSLEDFKKFLKSRGLDMDELAKKAKKHIKKDPEETQE